MILVLSGTADGRLIVQDLVASGYTVLASAATPYGGELLARHGAEIITGPLALDEMVALIKKRRIELLVDATHPYAQRVSEIARQACAQTQIPYLRYQRGETNLPRHPLIHCTAGYEEAAQQATRLGKVIFLTTGSKTLDIFLTAARRHGCRLVVRVLPEPAVIQRCRRLGLSPADIVAMQGPFSLELNRALFKQYGAEVVVTKNSGVVGGTDTKIAAALELALPVVVINRPREQDGAITTREELLEKIRKRKDVHEA
ncbi:precorrin-6A/cobalt-precorrin-6A reductase [Desulfofundulus luciae]|uniref:Precorrin-6A/cobalt-precorrin-6A reductase n=1 Tax=Desulfofundulus luciae TaxID=74702 RepID=A0ABU0B7P9_9FIRM|nr:precorrin-6A reductase [Desulfofundulus luciae]MDQ0287453.1 precorrin-6A/cobalt-precorrin-6A reductase [Desulfofundulus luciae]